MTELTWDSGVKLGTTLSNADRTATIDNNANAPDAYHPGGGQGGVRASIGRSTGKRYYEFVVNTWDPSGFDSPVIGITTQALMGFPGFPFGQGVGFSNNSYYENTTEGGTWGAHGTVVGWTVVPVYMSAGNRYGIKVDFDAGTVDIISLLAPEGTQTVGGGGGHNPMRGFTPGPTVYPIAGMPYGNGPDHTYTVTIYGRESEFVLPHNAAFIGWAMDVPVADFTSDPVAPATAVAPAIVQFTSTSTGDIATYLWTFNDGDTSDQANPVHAFHEAGTYAVSLTVSNSAGSNTKTVSTFITVTDPPVIGSDDRHPRIGYRCIALDNADAVVTSDSIATGYAAANLFDWKPYTYWKPATGGEHYVQIVIPEAEVADYIAIAQHNLGENAGTFRLSYSNDGGGTWSDAIADYSPSGRESIWLDFAAISARYWRVYTNSVTASVLGVVAFGRKYRPRYGQFAGFMPPKLARSFDLYASTSEAGLFLGRTILRKKLKGSIAFDLMEISDAYGDWHPFMQAAEQHPFFLAWLLEDWPEDVQLVETSGDWKAPAITQFGFIGTSITWIGLLQE